MKNLRLFIYILLAVFLPSVSWANAGVPMIFLGIPFMVAMLVPIIFIEYLIFKKAFNRDTKTLVAAITVANLVSTLVGYPLSWACQFALEFITTGGGANGVDTLWGKFVSVVLQSAWLVPYESDLYWMIPAAGLVGLIPAYFLSVFFESLVMRKFWKFGDETRAISWRANGYSYVFLAAVIVCILIYSILVQPK